MPVTRAELLAIMKAIYGKQKGILKKAHIRNNHSAITSAREYLAGLNHEELTDQEQYNFIRSIVNVPLNSKHASYRTLLAIIKYVTGTADDEVAKMIVDQLRELRRYKIVGRRSVSTSDQLQLYHVNTLLALGADPAMKPILGILASEVLRQKHAHEDEDFQTVTGRWRVLDSLLGSPLWDPRIISLIQSPCFTPNFFAAANKIELDADAVVELANVAFSDLNIYTVMINIINKDGVDKESLHDLINHQQFYGNLQRILRDWLWYDGQSGAVKIINIGNIKLLIAPENAVLFDPQVMAGYWARMRSDRVVDCYALVFEKVLEVIKLSSSNEEAIKWIKDKIQSIMTGSPSAEGLFARTACSDEMDHRRNNRILTEAAKAQESRKGGR